MHFHEGPLEWVKNWPHYFGRDSWRNYERRIDALIEAVAETTRREGVRYLLTDDGPAVDDEFFDLAVRTFLDKRDDLTDHDLQVLALVGERSEPTGDRDSLSKHIPSYLSLPMQRALRAFLLELAENGLHDPDRFATRRTDETVDPQETAARDTDAPIDRGGDAA